MIIFITGVFSGHILVKKIILSKLYCCNMIIFCKLLKIKIVQTSLCRGAFLAGEAMPVICGQRPHYITGALKGRNDAFA